MSRAKAINPKVRLHVTLTAELAGRIALHCADPLSERGYGYGAMSDFFEAAAREKLDRLAGVGRPMEDGV